MHSEKPATQPWRLYVDGSVTRNKSGAGIILKTPDGFKHEYALEFQFKASNNAAEYEALIGGLQLARGIRVERVEVFSDSQLVVNQVNESFEAKEPQLHSYQALSKAFMQHFKSASLSHISWKANRHADALARLATGGPGKGRKKTRIEVLGQPSISKTISEIFMVETGPREPTWMDPIIEFMKAGVRPEDRRQARKLQSRCARYTLMNGKLYRRGYNLPNLKCVTAEEREVIMGEIHEEVCGIQNGSRSLAHKVLRTGFFWPNMGAMADRMSARCHKCHLHANEIHSPSIALSILLSPWPFAQWGLDLIGILPTAPGQFKYVIVAVDYFTKWVEAEPLGKITIECVKNFLMKNIYCRFGVSETIVKDNGTQFNNNYLIEFTKGMGTKMVFASVAHPQTNGQVEAVNKIIKNSSKGS
ncbi:PREDICTED: uncharacterized protein LOC101309906 [Fragaria vesca subsp. vesca]|uniref:uncharacterized protein LOC101309906 n=1 Tax=Fragaria vesca subsp. vesca TaxID=101020 RepID=UPI0002C31B04|nr:PREDICTED: uncharacterized protein LOC101309906 [Fragaria vesca subsp. vesca]